ncbi:hypothetical protein ACO22_05636 [Paracoccidioides brasiliensis]|uniref:Pinin/SDK/MemA protein domain-containing protein n=1 Tax=Paracoccidioides brasiliensis TaxID=121759 RepID=A0A1D2J9R3_PARBR|nr:hypothetical protein ACO22_05636 [Paracoccidioides brasiliensis]
MLFPLEEQIRPRATQINNFRASIAILLQTRTLEAIKGVADPFASAHNAFILVVAERALIADTHKRCGPHVGIADGTFTVAFVTETADGDAGLLATHYEIGVVAGHDDGCGSGSGCGTISSAVALPEPEERPDDRLKRLQSLSEDNENKRRRLGDETRLPDSKENEPSPSAVTAPKPVGNTADGRDSRRKSGAAEERKRGQRLFGALLGTLSQSSSTAAQKRRADIEQKQLAKLRMQEAEYTELKRKKQEDLLAVRRKEQRIYERQSMRVRHSNQLAVAHFLKTTAEPFLYYKPWQLRPEEEDRIKQQIDDCKATIAKEVEEFEAKNPPSPRPTPHQPDTLFAAAGQTRTTVAPRNNNIISDDKEPKDAVQLKSDTVGDDTNNNNNRTEAESEPQICSPAAPATTNEPSTSFTTKSHNDNPSATSVNHHQKAHDDDSGEVMLEDKEDTVIY